MFMENEIDREEYVLADFGYIWVGSARRNEGIPWQFGQVKDSLLMTSSVAIATSTAWYNFTELLCVLTVCFYCIHVLV